MERLREEWTTTGPVKTTAPNEQLEALSTSAKASVADAAPLGLLGFGTATFAAGSVFAGWWGSDVNTAIMGALPALLIFGGITQFIAGMWSFRAGDVLGATGFGSFGAFNTLYSLYLILHATHFIPEQMVKAGAGGPLAITVAFFGAIALALSVGAMARNGALWSVLVTLALTYGFLSAGLFFGASTSVGDILTKIGGWCAVVSAALAFYTAAAVVVNSEFKRGLIPLGSPGSMSSGAPSNRRELA